MDEKMIAKAKAAKSADELLEIAKANGFDISQEQAKEIFARLNSDGELSDEELGAVAGGCSAYGHLTVTPTYSCDKWHRYGRIPSDLSRCCYTCDHKIYNKGLMQCEIQ